MAERSSTISGALLLTPTLCIVALRYGLPRINEVISNDIIIEISIHAIAIIFGLVMFSRYRVVEDHEYHRSATIKRLRKSYSHCLLYTSPSPRDLSTSRMPSSA